LQIRIGDRAAEGTTGHGVQELRDVALRIVGDDSDTSPFLLGLNLQVAEQTLSNLIVGRYVVDPFHGDPVKGDSRQVLRFPFTDSDLTTFKAASLQCDVTRTNLQHVPFGQPGFELNRSRFGGRFESCDKGE